MFPFVRLLKPSGLGPVMLVASLVVLNLTSTCLNQSPTVAPSTVAPTINSDIAYLDSLESHLEAKALSILERYVSDPAFVDLNIELESTAVTTTTYVPGDKILVEDIQKKEAVDKPASDGGCVNKARSQKWELTGTWEESNEVRPRIKTLKCCVTLTNNPHINADDLFRSLSYGLGIDLARGDILKIAYQ